MWAVLEPFVSSGCKEFRLHKMSDPACVMNAFSYSVSDGRVVELDAPTRADWTQQHPDGLFGTRVSLATPLGTVGYADMENSGQGAIVPSDAAHAEGFDISEGSAIVNGGRDPGEPAGRPVDEGCWPGTAQEAPR